MVVDVSSTISLLLGEAEHISLSISVNQPDAADQTKNQSEVAAAMEPHAADREVSTFGDPVSKLVAQMPPAYASTSLSSSESYYSNIVHPTNFQWFFPSKELKHLHFQIRANLKQSKLLLLKTRLMSVHSFAKMSMRERDKLKHWPFQHLSWVLYQGITGGFIWTCWLHVLTCCRGTIT